ncbi:MULTISPECIES: PTS sugar transporter subunit IIA [Mammaliicoccus]|uniref:Ascorbate-specific PTS system EIIA component n=1 Tax=Mammaliicoccus vitulinus TaxID=71237 RepID=A0ABX7HGP1_9STAP|nr:MULTISPECIES: PTS sugar transporter subunit IIA [Mammaliicoccus]HAL08642.1 PTS ascorbate transporter subunit IIA [Staphylococcus sp.]PNZ38709.1 PTS ascorbate transporter subunit IIA [Mammaliicoccus vitulinus]PTI37684.1 PTS ascorbate transporter subunit IIA [Mammaliicoccus vitulinus]PTI71905.1 PTS ascorbate transporter subunit IIA [Mammaliicoccus vitulinus]QRO85693.1 PTS sugar transporter subunit IIA [Mammaliicoccus vitulinus]
MTQIIKEEHIQLREKVANWEESIQVAAAPLLQEGYFNDDYVKSMIKSVHDMGPYIVIAPEIAIAHARPNDNVHKVGLSLLKLEEHINFSDNSHYASLVFVLSAIDNEAHLEILKKLATILSDKETVASLILANSKSEIINIFKEND